MSTEGLVHGGHFTAVHPLHKQEFAFPYPPQISPFSLFRKVVQLSLWKTNSIFWNGPTTANFFCGQIPKEGRAGVEVVHKECVAPTEQREWQEVHHGGVAESLWCKDHMMASKRCRDNLSDGNEKSYGHFFLQ
ncbi:hypothetical protein F7725_024798 [Dissostichus mawsoni]|uniref:Uncharacterized protein n=1 Tax=Dissostichus mawsoni TaxID=36200 RepID=A0A7J5X9B2_DISMA|nr:hypothetical protein F7725_024798 [Dissostichus mawsoni]